MIERESWHELLACPACGGQLNITVLTPNAETFCEEGILECRSCQMWYPVTNGIPRLFVPGPLRPDDRGFAQKWSGSMGHLQLDQIVQEEPKEDDKAQIQSTFGHKWTRQAWWGMEGESAEVMAEWLLPRYGWATVDEYKSFMAGRSVMLDAGCGLGREALRMAKANADALVIGLELSECVDEAARHAREQGVNNVRFIQADLMAPPIKSGIVDFIISEGVLHHTPSTKSAFRALVPLLADKGEFGFYVYRKKAPIREFTDDYVRDLIKDLPPDQAWSLMEPLTALGKTLSDLNIEIEIPEDVAVLGIKAGHYNLQRLIYYNMFKCYWNDRLTFDENVHVNFDWYHPSYAWRHTEEEIKSWLEESGLTISYITVEDSGITVRGKK
ncbi:MAG: methyltransferase domain-containing protein [Candidatus Saccharibacteria bacterium]